MNKKKKVVKAKKKKTVKRVKARVSSVAVKKRVAKKKRTKEKKIITLADWRNVYGVDIGDMDPNMKVADWMEQEGLRAGARVYRMLIGG